MMKKFHLNYPNHYDIITPLSWGCSSLGRALEWHSRGKGFDPPHLHFRGVRRTQMLSFT